MKEFLFLLERQCISSRLDFSQCAHNDAKLALLVHANENNPAKIDIVSNGTRRHLRERNAASGGEEMLRLRVYEKLQGLVGQGAVNRTITGTTKKYKGVAPRMRGLKAEMKLLRADWAKKLRAKAAARR